MDIEYQFWAKEQERNREARELGSIRRAQRIISAERRGARSSSDGGARAARVGRQHRLIPRQLE